MEHNYYSVPFEYVGKDVEIELTDNLLRVSYKHKGVALHPKLSGIYNSLEERLSYAKEKSLPYAEFLELLFVFIGNPGTGKTHLSIAVGIRAISKGHKILFTSTSEMLVTLNQAKADNSFYQKVTYYLTPELLILDELGFKKLPNYSADDFFQENLEDEWVLLLRQQLQQKFLSAQIKLLRCYAARDNWEEVIECTQQILEEDPYSEETHLIAMEGYIKMENHANAIKHYKNYKKIMEDELKLSPSKEMDELYQKALKRGS